MRGLNSVRVVTVRSTVRQSAGCCGRIGRMITARSITAVSTARPFGRVIVVSRSGTYASIYTFVTARIGTSRNRRSAGTAGFSRFTGRRIGIRILFFSSTRSLRSVRDHIMPWSLQH